MEFVPYLAVFCCGFGMGVFFTILRMQGTTSQVPMQQPQSPVQPIDLSNMHVRYSVSEELEMFPQPIEQEIGVQSQEEEDAFLNVFHNQNESIIPKHKALRRRS